jgi:hypothetical protein
VRVGASVRLCAPALLARRDCVHCCGWVAGLSASKMGVIQGGGQWPNRLGKRCFELVGELGEDVIYDMYVQSSESSHREVEKPEEEYAVMFRCELCNAQ